MAYYARRLAVGPSVYRRRVYGRRRFRRPYRGSYRVTPLYKTVGKNHMQDCLAVYHNPFSVATTNPKIPDGKVYASTGLRLQAVAEVVNDGTESMDILLFPGLSNGLTVSSSTGGTPAGTPWSIPYKAHGRFSQTTTYPLEQLGTTPIHKWRLVSQGLKITLINNSDENDGWFEAIRIQGNADGGFKPTLSANEPAGSGSYIGAGGSTTLPAVQDTNLVEHPTYVTGKLRDIHKYLFHLMPQGNDHDFTIISKSQGSDEEFANACLDNESFDMVFIRVHGRTQAANGTPTRLMVHVVANQEIVYEEASFMTRYHSESKGNDALFKASKRKKQESSINTRAAKSAKHQLIQSAVG